MACLFIVPALLWIVLAYGLYSLLDTPVDTLSNWLAGFLDIPVAPEAQGWWNGVKAFLNGAREIIVSFILHLAIVYLLFIANKYIVLILLSPLLAYASERTEEILTGKNYPFSWAQLLKDAFRGALIALRNGVLELSISIGIWFVAIPCTDLVHPALSGLVLFLRILHVRLCVRTTPIPDHRKCARSE